jgi:putative aldouronate transport system substrate-binding protein
MKRKRLIASILVATLSFTTLLSGCGKKDSTTKESSEAEATVDESGKVNGVMYAEGLPIVDAGDYSFSLFVDDSTATGEFYMMDELEKQTGVKVDLQYYPYDIAKERLSLDLSSGDYADCIGGWTLTDKEILTYGVQMGTFVPLEDYFEKYCPNIMAILDQEGVRETMTAPDGHIYSIPYVMEAPQVDFNPYINTRWLKNLGLEMPKTTEELRTVLKAFKEQDANGNGDPNDEIPFSFNPDQKQLGYLCGWFGMSVDEFGFTMVDDKLTFGANTEEFKNGISYLRSLYADGLLDQEMFTQDNAQWKAKGGQDLYGVCMMYGSGDIMPYDAGVKPDWEPLNILDSETGVAPVWLKKTYGTNVLKTQVVITDKAKNPAAICRWWDNVFALENSIQINRGPLDKVVFKEGDTYRAIDTNTLTEEEKEKYNWSNLWPQSLPKYIPNGFRFAEDNPMYEEKPVVDEQYGPYLTKEVIPSYWASEEDAAKLTDLQTSIKDYITQKMAEWIAGQADIDKEWDSYVEQLDKLDLKEYVELRQKALNK